MKKFLLIIALIISGLGLNAQNVGNYKVIDYEDYSLKFKVTSLEPAECEVYGYTAPTSSNTITIPSKAEIEGVEFTVTSIGSYAFNGAGSGVIENVIFEEDCQLKEIKSRAFEYCHVLTGIIIPKSVTTIGSYAFADCNSLESISVEEGNTVYDSRDNCNAIIRTNYDELAIGCKNTVIPNTVTSIGSYAFSRSNLESIEIPNSVQWINSDAFEKCTGLTSIYIPSSVTYIMDNPFNGCSNLESIQVDENNPDYDSRDNCNAIISSSNVLVVGCKNTVLPNTVTSIGGYAFEGCSSLTNIEIPESVTHIGWHAFSGCSSLTDIKIPNGVTTISQYTFYNCKSMRKIEIPSTVNYIDYGAFQQCSGLKSIRCMADNVPGLYSDNVFSGVSSSTVVQVPENSVELYKAAEGWNKFTIIKLYPYHYGDYVINEYEGYSLRFTVGSTMKECEVKCEVAPQTPVSITIPSSVTINDTELNVTSIGDFSNCDSLLLEVEIPECVTNIGICAFEKCTGLTSVEIPSAVTVINGSTFYGCTGLTSITFAENSQLETIGSYAFYGCTSLIDIEIPDGVTNIEDAAFNGCTSLTSINIPNGVTSLGIISEYSTEGDEIFFGCSSLQNVNFGEDSQLSSIGWGAFENCSSLESIEIPNGVTCIGAYAFAYCTKLTNVTFKEESQLANIGKNAFKECISLTSIELPSSLTSLENGYYAYKEGVFYKCTNLTNVTFGDESQLTYIGEAAFGYCSSLTNIEIPESVNYIGRYAFESLKILTCHAENVPETDQDAFLGYHMIVYVPENSVEAYKSTAPWNEHTIYPIGGVGFPSFVNYENYSLRFDITDLDNKECEVSCYVEPTVETELTIPSTVKINKEEYTVTAVADSAFLGCKNFVGDLVIPNSVKRVGVRAFRDCTGFTGSIVLSENLETIEMLAFAGGNDLIVNYTGTLNIPSSVTSIKTNAFQNCQKITGIVVEEGNTVYDSREDCNAIIETSTNTLVFGCQNSVVPNGITSIGESAFVGCYGLQNIELPNSVTSIGNYAFRGCTGLTGDLTIPNNVTYLGGGAFWDCCGFDGNLTLSENIDTIFGYTFASYDTLMHFKGDFIIPNNVKYIGDAAFQNCYDLKHVGVGDIEKSQLTYIGKWAFTLCENMTSVDIPGSVKNIEDYAFNCKKLALIKCYAENVPTTGENAFANCDPTMKIYVHKSSVNKYKSKNPWSKFMILPLDDGLEEMSSSISIYPNPVNDRLYIETEYEIEDIIIYDVYGKQQELPAISSTIDVSGLSNGVYFVKVVTENGNIVKRVVKN